MAWRFWQKQKTVLPPQKVPASDMELTARTGIGLPRQELEQLHQDIESTGRAREIYPILWAASKIGGKTQSLLRKPDGTPLGMPELGYTSAVLELLYLVGKGDKTPDKAALGQAVDALRGLSDVDRIIDPKTEKKTLVALKTFIDGQRAAKAAPAEKKGKPQ